MDNKGYQSSACLDILPEYKLDGLEDDINHEWVEMTIERCNQTKTTCADDSEIDDFI